MEELKPMRITFPIILLLTCMLISCSSSGSYDPILYARGIENGLMAQEGFERSNRYLQAWLAEADTATGLIPRNLTDSRDLWNAQDAAADNYPFMVLTSFFTDYDLYEGEMRKMLETEIQLTSRIGNLPDTYSFSRAAFELPEIDTSLIIFGASEYVKDGLLPITEWLGETPWSERMILILDDIWEYAPVKTPYGNIPSRNVEINGEMLQTLARVYWMTGEKKYLDWALRLGDYYLLDNHPTRDMNSLRLRDHGCEIVSGLCELYFAVHYAIPSKKQSYQPLIYEMLDRILEVGRNEDGLFYNVINPRTGEIQDNGIADNFGYTYNGYYTVYLLDNKTAYRDAVLKALRNLNKYRNYDWERGSADGYADAIEGAINLYNREPEDGLAEWIESQIQVMWMIQDSSFREHAQRWKGSGIIEGWHGDGNFACTSLMFSLWKTGGAYVRPWREDMVMGVTLDEDTLSLFIRVEEDWFGKLFLDPVRHQRIFHLPLDYPRINQFPAWWPVKDQTTYWIIDHHGGSRGKKKQWGMSGFMLARGDFEMELEGGKVYQFDVYQKD